MCDVRFDAICIICKSYIKDAESKFNLSLSITKYSCTNLIDFIENIIKSKLVTVNSFVCDKCINILNDLDYFENKYNENRSKLLSYLPFEIISEIHSKAESVITKAVDSNYACDKCHILLSSLEELAQHNSTHVEKHRFECEACHKIFISKNRLTHHMKNKHAEQECKNTIETTFIKEENIEKEVQLIEEFAPELDEPKKKRGRKKAKSDEIPKPFQCNQCQKMWKTVTELKVHAASHNTSTPYICEVCGQAYKHKAAIEIHIGMHKGINPFTCIYCNKSFTQKGALQRHIPIHTGETQYQCDLCGKRFLHHTSFRIHQLSHTGQKAYKCNVCGTSLMSGSHLKRHMRAHTGERKFECPTCGKRFAERYNLVAHQKLHENPSCSNTNNKKLIIRCQQCSFCTNTQAKLDKHLDIEHNADLLATKDDSLGTAEYLAKPPPSENQIWQNIQQSINKVEEYY